MTQSARHWFPESAQNDDLIELQIVGNSNQRLNESPLDGSRYGTTDNPAFGAEVGQSSSRSRPRHFPSALTMPRALDQLQNREQSVSSGRDASVYCTTRRTKYNTIRMKNAAMCRGRDCLDERTVVDNISSDPELNQPSPESEQLRMELIRDLHCSLPLKRHLKRNVSRHLSQRQRVVRGPSMRFRIRQGFRALRTKAREGFRCIDPWHDNLRTIEGRFGSSTAYYFRFLQLLVTLNLIIFAISVAFILLPQLLWRFDGNYQAPSANTTATSSPARTVTAGPLSDDRRTLPLVQRRPAGSDITSYSLIDRYDADDGDGGDRLEWADLLTGSGYLANTELYYGAYVNSTVNVSRDYFYNLPLAYLLSTACHLCLCLVLLAKWVGSAYKHHITVHCGYGAHTFCNMVFCSWDFSITSEEAARFKMGGISRKFQEKVRRLRKNVFKMTCCDKFEKYSRIVVNHIVVVAILAGSGAVTWFLLESNPFQVDTPILTEMALPLIITGILIVLPFTFSLLIRYEGYQSKGTKVYITIIRMMLLLMTVLGVLCYFWFRTNYEKTKDGRGTCWETELGEEIYRLLLVDFVVVNILSLFVGFVHTFVLRRRIFENPKFNLAWNTWNLIYTQMLCWLGSFYFPMVSGLVIVKLLLTFYIRQLHLRVNCTPPDKPWGATQLRIAFLSYAFLGLVAMLVPVGYSIIAMTPSQECGPFRGKQTAYAVVFDTLEASNIDSAAFGQLAYFVSLPGCVAGILIVLGAIAFQVQSRATANRHLVERMQHQLQMEKNDKAFLLRLLDGAFAALQTRTDSVGNVIQAATNGTNAVRFRAPLPHQAGSSLSDSSVFDNMARDNRMTNNNNNNSFVQTHNVSSHRSDL